MSIAVLVNTHGNEATTNDTLDSIHSYITSKTLTIIDGKCDQDLHLISPKIIGMPVANRQSPFKNAALGLSHLYNMYPDSNWFGYMDYDCLVGSSYILSTLDKAEQANLWVLGNDGRAEKRDLPMLDWILGEPIQCTYYMLGCCQFYHKKFLDKLYEIEFFDKFLTIMNCYDDDRVIGYNGYDLNEHMYPSLARHFGADVGVMASYFEGQWHGSYMYYPMRFRPCLTMEDNFPTASILHPIKEFDNPIRELHRKKRHEHRSFRHCS